MLASTLAVVLVAVSTVSATAAPPSPPQCFGRDATIVGSAHRDVIKGTPGADVIVTGDGADRVEGRGGDDVICTGTGNDVVRGSAGGDLINGGEGADSINSGPGFFDDVVGGPGNDSLNGGRDHQGLVDYTSAPAAVNVSLTSGKATGGDGKDSVVNFDSIQGSAFDDVLDGDSTRFGNGLFGGNGNDTITGRAGPDILVGEGGNDSLDGGPQGTGDLDFAGYRYAPGPVVVDLSSGTATGWGTDTLTNVEGVSGSDTFGDSLTGDGGDNVLIPFGGNDRVDGGPGNDFVGYASATNNMTINLSTGVASGQGSDTLTNIENAQGSSKDDSLTGSSSANVLLAGPGKDSISAGAGDDQLNGGDGNDTLDGGDGDDSCIDGEKDTNCETKEHSSLIGLAILGLEGLQAYR